MSHCAQDYEDDLPINKSEGYGIFDEDMEALRRACMLNGTDPTTATAVATSSESAAESDEEDDLKIFQTIQKHFFVSFDGSQLPLSPPHPLPTAASVSDDNDHDDFETFRAIQRRFACYDCKYMKTTTLGNSLEDLSQKPEQVPSLTIASEDTYNDMSADTSYARKNILDNEVACNTADLVSDNIERGSSGFIEAHQSDAPNLSTMSVQHSSFPKSAKMFFDAIKKNRSFQKFIMNKMIQTEARTKKNRKLIERVKVLKDFMTACRRRTGLALSQMKDLRAQLITTQKLRTSNNSKMDEEKVSAVHCGPAENSRVGNYRIALTKYSMSLPRKKWSDVERANLVKGIRQQFHEMILQISMDRLSHSDGSTLDDILVSIKNHEITSEQIPQILPKVNWDQLASTYAASRSSAECEARWLNFEDPLINHSPWTSPEDKKLLLVVQKMGMSNWFDIAVSLKANRTPFQCLARYQRSLNSSILKKEWSKEEDDQLRIAVETFGESDWQNVASIMQGRTGPQCSNRWLKSLHPARLKVGRWAPGEDKRLKVAVMLFGPKNWNKIAESVPGRTQVQCRERWVNSLDPSLKWGEWTEEEDSKLRVAILEHGYCWSKVAAGVPSRTDNQCRRRWKVLLPDEVPLHQATIMIQKTVFIGNFVERKSERPALDPKDFIPVATTSITKPEPVDSLRKRKRKSRSSVDQETNVEEAASCTISRPRRSKVAKICLEGVQVITNQTGVESLGECSAGAFVSNGSKLQLIDAIKSHPISCPSVTEGVAHEILIPSDEVPAVPTNDLHVPLASVFARSKKRVPAKVRSKH